MTMDRIELLRCMREAAGALAEFRHFLPVYCPEAVAHLEQALHHFELALQLCGQGVADDDDDEDDDDDDDEGGGGKPSGLRIRW